MTLKRLYYSIKTFFNIQTVLLWLKPKITKKNVKMPWWVTYTYLKTSNPDSNSRPPAYETRALTTRLPCKYKYAAHVSPLHLGN